jgi:uncharacterized protein (DUF433 family)
MIELETTQVVPLTLGEDGTIRITGSRVSLDSVIDEFKQGATAEQIQEDFPSLALRDVYAAIAYYLARTELVEAYLRQQAAAAEETRRFMETQQPAADLRERLRTRRLQLRRPPSDVPDAASPDR